MTGRGQLPVLEGAAVFGGGTVGDLRFDGRVAIVTGAGRGIGRAHAMLLAERGAKVVVNDLGCSVEGQGADPGPAHEVVEEIRRSGGVAVASEHSVASVDGARSIVATALEHFDRLDIIVNNAGIFASTKLSEITSDEFHRHLSVHLAGAFFVNQAAWPHLVEQSYGRIINTSSGGIAGDALLVPYSSAKAGVIGLTRSLSVAGRAHGIRVNAVMPGGVSRMAVTDPEALEAFIEVAATFPPLPPELASPTVAFLAHETCPVSGEVFGTIAGKVTRVFLAETTGYINQALTPEDVRDNWETINDVSTYSAMPDNMLDHMRNFFAAFPTNGTSSGV